MPKVDFTSHLQRYINVEPMAIDGHTVAEVLDQLFLKFPPLRSYLLDDHGSLRQHVMIFVDAQLIADRRRQTDQVRTDSEIFIAQALSGG